MENLTKNQGKVLDKTSTLLEVSSLQKSLLNALLLLFQFLVQITYSLTFNFPAGVDVSVNQTKYSV